MAVSSAWSLALSRDRAAGAGHALDGPVVQRLHAGRRARRLALEGKTNYHTDYRWADLEQISPHAAVAVIASEDQLFPFHAGFDFKSIREAIRATSRRQRRRPHIARRQHHLAAGGQEPVPVERPQLLAQGTRGLLHAADRAHLAEGTHPRGVSEHRASSAAASTASRPRRSALPQARADLGRTRPRALAAVLPSPRRYRADQSRAATCSGGSDQIEAQMARSGRHLLSGAAEITRIQVVRSAGTAGYEQPRRIHRIEPVGLLAELAGHGHRALLLDDGIHLGLPHSQQHGGHAFAAAATGKTHGFGIEQPQVAAAEQFAQQLVHIPGEQLFGPQGGQQMVASSHTSCSRRRFALPRLNPARAASAAAGRRHASHRPQGRWPSAAARTRQSNFRGRTRACRPPAARRPARATAPSPCSTLTTRRPPPTSAWKPGKSPPAARVGDSPHGAGIGGLRHQHGYGAVATGDLQRQGTGELERRGDETRGSQ